MVDLSRNEEMPLLRTDEADEGDRHANKGCLHAAR